MHSVITAVGASATVWALVSGCDTTVGVGGKAAVSKDALQTDIANRLAKAGEQPQSVTCKEDLIGEVGKTARCDVVMSPTNSFEPVITVTGVDGSTINYEMSPALSKEQLEKAVSRLVDRCRRMRGRLGVVRVRIWTARSARSPTATSTPGESNCDAPSK